MHGRTIDIAGSASSSANRDVLRLAHDMVAHLATRILDDGGNLIVLAGRDPRIDQDDASSAQTFTWTIVETVKAHFDKHSNQSAKGRILALVSNSEKMRIPDNRAALWQELLDRQIITPHFLDETRYIGGRIREREVSLSDALVAIGGGKGVADLAVLHRERGHPILPIDIQVGASCDDGDGSRALYRDALVQPEHYVPNVSLSQRSELALLFFQAGTDGLVLAERVARILGEAWQTEARPIKAIVCYSREDAGMKTELLEHLSVMVRERIVDLWHDGLLEPGANWSAEISNHLRTAKLVLLLVSSSFNASTYIWSKELPVILERSRQGEVVIVPIVVRPCDLDAELAQLQALPLEPNGRLKDVESWGPRRADRDLAWKQIAQRVRSMPELELRNRLSPPREARDEGSPLARS